MTTTSILPKQEMIYPPGKYVSVYVTAKRIHAGMLLDLRKDWPHLYFTARWPIVRDISSEQSKPAHLWLQDNTDDIIRSDVVVFYAEPDDVLSGSIWETAVGWTHGKEIYLAGSNPGFKEWRFAPRVRCHLTDAESGKTARACLDDALAAVTGRLRYQKSSADQILEKVDLIRALITEKEKR